MAMGRASMGKQIATAPKKMMVGGALGALAAGDIRGAIPGVVPQMLVQKKLQEEAENAKRKKDAAPMAKGGMVRGDGCCRNGKTKGKMC